MAAKPPIQNRQAPPAGGGSRVVKIRRRRKLRQLRFFALCTVFAGLVIAYFVGAFDLPMSWIQESIITLQLSTRSETELPIGHGVEDAYAATSMGSGLAVVGSREVVLYGQNGAELRRIPHGYTRLGVTANSTRLAIYSRAGKQLLVEGRTKSLYTHTEDSSILLTNMSPRGKLAVATRADLRVYNTKMAQTWAWTETGETPIALAFSENESNLAVACIEGENGALGTRLRCFSLYSSAQPKEIYLAGGYVLQMQYVGRARLLVVCDTFTGLYNTESGEQVARYDYGARVLQSADMTKSGETALLFGGGDYASVSSLVLLDKALVETASVSRKLRAKRVLFAGAGVHLFGDTTLETFGRDGVFYGERTTEFPILGLDEKAKLLVTTQTLEAFQFPTRTEAPKV